MTFTVATYAEARKIASDCRRTYAGLDWIVTISHPLFKGDLYRVNVN